MAPWFDYLPKDEYQRWVERPRFEKATEPKESWLTKAFERFRTGAEAVGAAREPSPLQRIRQVEREMQPAAPTPRERMEPAPAIRPPLQRFREVEREMQPAVAEFERAAPPASTLQRFREVEQRLQPSVREEPTYTFFDPIALSREREGREEEARARAEEKALRFTDPTTGRERRVVPPFDPQEKSEKEINKWLGQYLTGEAKDKAGWSLPMSMFMAYTESVIPEKVTEPIGRIPVVGPKAEEFVRATTSPATLPLTAAWPGITARMGAYGVGGWAAGRGLEKVGVPTTEVGPITVGPAGVLETTGFIGGPVAGPTLERLALRGVARTGRATLAEIERVIPTVRQVMTEEIGGLKPRPPTRVQPVGKEEALARWRTGLGAVGEIEASIGRGLEGKTLGARPAGPPRKPPTAETAGGLPAESAGNRFVAPLREFDDVVAEVVTSENPVVRALAQRTGINPSILRDTPTGKALTAYWRQRVSGDLLSEVAISPAIDVHAQMFTGRMGGVFRIGIGGEIKNLTVKPGQSRMWYDVFSRPSDYTLTTSQRAFVNDYLTVVREVEAMRVAAGLKPRGITSKEGWFYVPRQVKGIRGVELRRPSNPALQRIYEEAQEGVAAGIRYSDSPRATLEIHVRAAYREVLEAQLTEALAPLSITPRELVPRPVVARMEEATRKWVAANREVRRLRVPRVEKAGAVTAEEKALRTKLKFQRGKAAENLEAARAEYYKVKNIYSRAMDSARKAEVAPGNLFGQAEEAIPIASWRNRFFPREQADALNEGLGSFLRPAQKASPFSRGLEVLGNYIRFLSAVGDFAEPLIQGLPTFAYRPNVWAKSALRHYQAFFDPTVQSRFMRGRIGTFQKMAQHGAPIGDPEFFAALTREGGLPAGRLLEVLPKGTEARRLLQQGGKQSFGRFQASYNTGLGSNRALLYESLQPTWKGTEGQLWQFIKNMTGGLDSRALGVGPSQRGFESVWLAFSPRLLRSTAALVADAARPWTPQGQAALKALAGLCSVGAGIYVLTGLALGKSWEEIGSGLNPTQGKKFLSHEINGDWIGIGGQVRAISQFMAHSISAIAPGGEPIESFISKSQFENPILSFYSSRGAPAMNIVGGLVEAGTGLNVLPFDQVDSLPDLLKHLGTSAMPFAVQGKLEGEQWGTTGAALVGFRTSAETVYEQRNRARDEMAQRMFGKPWDQLLQGQQNEVRAAEPTLRELETEAIRLGAERGYDYSKRTEGYRAEKDTRGDQGERLLEADPTGREWVRWRKTVGTELNTVWDMLTQRYGIKEEPREPEFAADRLAERYWNLELDVNNDGLISDEEWGAYDAEREAILSEARAAGVSEDYIKRGYRGKMWPNHPRLQAVEEDYQRVKEIAHEYLSLPRKIGMSAEEQQELRPHVEVAQGIARMRGLPFESAVLLLDIPESQKVRVMLYRELPNSTARDSWRYANPEEAQLYDTFYGDVPLGMAQGVGVGGGGQSPFWQTVGGSPTTEHQPVGGAQPSSFWQTVTGGVR